MSTLSVEIKKIVDVQKHPNADRLDLIQIEGWWCVTKKGTFKKGDTCVYFPVDSMLPPKLEFALFPPTEKVHLKNGRIKAIRLRQVFSEGLAVPVDAVQNFTKGFIDDNKLKEGCDLTGVLGVKKYEPPLAPPTLRGGRIRKIHLINPDFHKYTEIEHVKKFLGWFKPTDIVIAREKIHGTNYRVGWVPNKANTRWKKFLNIFGLMPKYEFCFGSRKLQLTDSAQMSIMRKNPFVPSNVYERITLEYKFKKLLQPGEVLYGEIYGPNVQKGYHYGLKEGQLGFVAFDLEVNGKYLSDEALQEWCILRQIPLAPFIYKGPFQIGELIKLNVGNSLLAPSQKAMEGMVIRPIEETADVRGRKIGKLISEEYSLKGDDEITEYQ